MTQLDSINSKPYSHAMSRQAEKLKKIYRILKGKYPDAATFLVHRNPYELMVAVILSARTTDAQVNRITPELFDKYPDPPSLMKAEIGDVERIVFPTGFYKVKARNIVAAAGEVVLRFGGTVPEKMEDLLTISGVGRKSANVIRAHSFSKPAVIVDTHFSRVVKRLELTKEENPLKIEKQIASICPGSIQTEFSMVINIHGREVCYARKPECIRCSVSSLCSFAGNN